MYDDHVIKSNQFWFCKASRTEFVHDWPGIWVYSSNNHVLTVWFVILIVTIIHTVMAGFIYMLKNVSLDVTIVEMLWIPVTMLHWKNECERW